MSVQRLNRQQTRGQRRAHALPIAVLLTSSLRVSTPRPRCRGSNDVEGRPFHSIPLNEMLEKWVRRPCAALARPTGTHEVTPALFVAKSPGVETRVPAPRIVRQCRYRHPRWNRRRTPPSVSSSRRHILLVPIIRGLARSRISGSRKRQVAGRNARTPVPATNPQLAGATHSSEAPSLALVVAARRVRTGATLATLGAVAACGAARSALALGGLGNSSASPSMTACSSTRGRRSRRSRPRPAGDLRDVVPQASRCAYTAATGRRTCEMCRMRPCQGSATCRRRQARWSPATVEAKRSPTSEHLRVRDRVDHRAAASAGAVGEGDVDGAVVLDSGAARPGSS